MMQHVMTNPVWQVKTGFNKRHSRQLINVLTNDAALHYKPIVAVQDWLQQKAQLINVSTMMQHCTTTLVWQVRMASTKGLKR